MPKFPDENFITIVMSHGEFQMAEAALSTCSEPPTSDDPEEQIDHRTTCSFITAYLAKERQEHERVSAGGDLDKGVIHMVFRLKELHFLKQCLEITADGQADSDDYHHENHWLLTHYVTRKIQEFDRSEAL